MCIIIIFFFLETASHGWVFLSRFFLWDSWDGRWEMGFLFFPNFFTCLFTFFSCLHFFSQVICSFLCCLGFLCCYCAIFLAEQVVECHNNENRSGMAECYGTAHALYHPCRLLCTVYSPSPQLIGSAPGIRARAFTTRRHPRSVLLSRRCLVPARLLLQIPPIVCIVFVFKYYNIPCFPLNLTLVFCFTLGRAF